MNKQTFEKDYNNYDYLFVTLKKSGEESLMECYRALGWEMLEARDGGFYTDETNYALRRPHKIANKDKLQLLQVRVETEANKLVKYVNSRHSKSISFGLIWGLIALAAVVCGVVFMLLFNTALWYILGGVIIGAGVIVGVADFLIVKKITRWENEIFNQKVSESAQKLKDTLERIKKIAEAEDGRQ